jgi:UDP-glucose 4-epimerase
MKIYVTGGTGFIGSYVVKALSQDGHRIVILARDPGKVPALAKFPGVKIVKAPMNDAKKLKRAIKDPDALIHIALCWGDTGPEMIKNETLASVSLIETALKAGAKKIIYTSSTAAQGSLTKTLDESAKPSPCDFYGATKASVEMFISAYSRCFKDINFISIRPGYTFGDPAVEGGAMENDRRFFDICRKALSGEPIELTKNDGTQFIWAGHLAELYLKVLLSRAANGVYYGLSKNFVTWEQIASWAVGFAEPLRGKRVKSRIIMNDLRWSDNPFTFNVSRIKKQFGLSFSSKELLKAHVKFLINNPGVIPAKK